MKTENGIYIYTRCFFCEVFFSPERLYSKGYGMITNYFLNYVDTLFSKLLTSDGIDVCTRTWCEFPRVSIIPNKYGTC